MTDADLIAKKLAFIETCLSELRRLADLARLETDIKERRFVEHTLQLCLQAIQDVTSHVVSDERLGEPETNKDLFVLMQRAGWLEPALVDALTAAVGFRNVIVHGYTSVDLAVVRDVVENHLGELQAFVDAVRKRLKG